MNALFEITDGLIRGDCDRREFAREGFNAKGQIRCHSLLYVGDYGGLMEVHSCEGVQDLAKGDEGVLG